MSATANRLLNKLNKLGSSAQPFTTKADLAAMAAILLDELDNRRPAEFCTIAELMRVFGVGRDKIANALSKCNVPAVQLGSRVLYDRTNAINALKQRFSA